MQKVFSWSNEDSFYKIKFGIENLIEDGYVIDNVSHSVCKVGYEQRYSCIVIARKVQ